MKNFVIYTDGASRGNPGEAASAFIIKTADGLIWYQQGVYLGQATNNQAEYQAVKLALEKLNRDFKRYLPSKVEIRADSLLIVKQLSGEYKLKNLYLVSYFKQIKELEKLVGEVSYLHIPRAENFLADKLANIALDAHEGI